MRASAWEYTLRNLTQMLIFALGFWAPWNYVLHLDARGPNSQLWGVLAAMLAKTGFIRIEAAYATLLITGIFFATVSALLRTWGTSYLGAAIVQARAMDGDAVMADGPYRYMRNPLYLGTWVHTLALALLMPPSGAIFAIVATGMAQIRLILGEEPFLTKRLGAAYTDYKAVVPRIMPSLHPKVAGTGARPAWRQAVRGELYFWGAAGSFAVAGWQYNASVLLQCLLISVGVALVVRRL